MTTRLRIYNGALLHCGETRLASLSENRKARHDLDEVWNDGGVRYCLEQGQWKFAMRASKFDYEADVTPEFGYRYAFAKPSDWVATSAVCSDEFFNAPLLRYVDEAGYWYCDLTELYVRYISDDESFGGDLTAWPSSFSDYVKAYFALRVVRSLTRDEEIIARVEKAERSARLAARNSDAMAGPALRPSPGSWIRSRVGYRGGPFGDGGSSGSLTG